MWIKDDLYRLYFFFLFRFGIRFPAASNIYTPSIRKVAKEAADELNIDLKEGVYIMNIGPSFETIAEAKMLAAMGGDVVGESTS